MKIQINNYSVNTNEILSIYPPKKYIYSQINAGCSVVEEYKENFYGQIYHTSIKYLWNKIYSKDRTFKYFIVYDDPDEDRKIQNVVRYAFKNGITVFFRERSNCEAGLTPVYSELVKQNSIYHRRPGDTYDYMGSYYTEAPDNGDFPLIDDKTKAKIRRYIVYYDITRPETEYDWYLAYEQVKYYQDNNMDYIDEEGELIYQDKNLYTICKECGELIHRGTEEEHVCYCDIVPKRLKMDYIVNGEV